MWIDQIASVQCPIHWLLHPAYGRVQLRGVVGSNVRYARVVLHVLLMCTSVLTDIDILRPARTDTSTALVGSLTNRSACCSEAADA